MLRVTIPLTSSPAVNCESKLPQAEFGTPVAIHVHSPSRFGNHFPAGVPIMHLAISCSCYLLFLMAKALMPTQPASWRLAEQRSKHRR